ncbi:hypothetical protein MTO96_021790 [Rhipicephalus appendiculatus]
MWSLGVILYVMMTAALPFEDGNIVRQVRLQMNRMIRFPRHMESTHEYRNLVRLLLEPVTTIRATMGMVVKHPWLLLYPDPTNTLTREVEPRAVSPVLRGPVLVNERRAVIDERGDPLPPLTRQPAVEDVHTGGIRGGTTLSRRIGERGLLRRRLAHGGPGRIGRGR